MGRRKIEVVGNLDFDVHWASKPNRDKRMLHGNVTFTLHQPRLWAAMQKPVAELGLGRRGLGRLVQMS